MKMHDGKLKDLFRGVVKSFNKGKYEQYVKTIRERSVTLPAFTLFTSDCMAGLIYHTMGRQFLTPTVNLWMREPDYLKFLTDMQYYLSQDIRFIESDTYPKGTIGDGEKEIKLFFEHYKTDEEAREKWDERKQRITDNIFVVVADTGLTDEQMETFRHMETFLSIKRKVMFTWDAARADGQEIFLVKKYGREKIKKWSRLRKDGFRDYEIFFDYVAWMNMEEDFMLDTP